MSTTSIMQLSEAVTLERVGEHVALVTIDRPQARNAVNGAVAAGLDQAVRTTEADADLWCVILTGAGDQAFCAGADLKAVAAGEAEALSTERGGFAGFVHHPRQKPWIAAVNGFALAGGTEIALACDLIVAVEGARFGLPEVQRGLVAAAGGLYRLARAIPRAVALELILTGEMLAAQRAWQVGLVNHLVAPADLRAQAIELAERICANAPIAVRKSLAVARAAFDHDDTTLRRFSEQAMAEVAATNDFQEGPRAFIEKRAPRWSGT